MAIQNIVIGTPGAGGGDPAYTAFTKINQNFSNPQHAASRMVGTGAGNVMEVGAFGLGGAGAALNETSALSFIQKIYGKTQVVRNDVGTPQLFAYGAGIFAQTGDTYFYLTAQHAGAGLHALSGVGSTSEPYLYVIKTNRNTWTDSNGFIKAASPVLSLFSNKVEFNEEAQLQDISFEKIGIGDYLIKGSSGFAQEGWYIETPKDANGNILFSVIYTTLENGDISVKTYKKKFDFETASIVADLDNPIDITENRWIGLRLQELPRPEIQIPKSIAPPNFQPTGLAEAVATVMESYHDSEQ